MKMKVRVNNRYDNREFLYDDNRASIGSHKTSIFEDKGVTFIVYHKTAVVKFNDDSIILNTGGWETPTTKKRMNQTSDVYNLGFQVFQKAFNWYVNYQGKILEFDSNEIKLSR